MGAVEIRGVAKRFGTVEVLRGIDLDIAPGEFMTLLGPSGCGKSTLLRIIAGLEHQDSGAIRLAGKPVDALPPKARDVAMVFQSYALYPHMTVRENIALPLVMRRLSSPQRFPGLGALLPGAGPIRAGIESEVRQVAAALDIGALLDRKPGQLSGGQKQRVALGRAMVRRPIVFLMDEPLSNLDAKLRVHMRAELAELHRRLGVTMIYVTHDQVEAMTMSDRVAVMIGGNLLQVGRPAAIYADPDSLAVAEFVGSPKINVLPPLPTLPCSASRPAGVAHIGVRPESLMLSDAGPLRGQVRLIEHLGADCLIHLAVPGVDQPMVARVGPAEAAPLGLGAMVGLAIQPGTALYFDADGRRIRHG